MTTTNDSERLDWLDANPARLQRVVNEGGLFREVSVRDVIDRLRALPEAEAVRQRAEADSHFRASRFVWTCADCDAKVAGPSSNMLTVNDALPRPAVFPHEADCMYRVAAKAPVTIQQRLLRALASLPPRHFVNIQTETDPESGTVFLSACLFENPPEDGWPSWGARFGHPPDAPTHHKPADEPLDPRVIVAITADPRDEAFWERLAAMLEERASALGVKP